MHEYFPNLRVCELDFAVENLFHCLTKRHGGAFNARGSFLPNIKSFTLRGSVMALRKNVSMDEMREEHL